tara:strand:+ start:2457 stop:2708 length:252 start_codon:yes stop_codon:yes gene_type:complete
LNTLTFGFLPKTLRRIIRYPLVIWYIFLCFLILDRLYGISGFKKIFQWNDQQTFLVLLISFTLPQLISLILKIFFYNNSEIEK